VLAVVLGITAFLVTQSEPAPPKPDCEVPPCGPPPKPSPPPNGPPLSPALVAGTPFESKSGYRLEFDPSLWRISNRTATDVELKVLNENVTVIVRISAQPAGDAQPQDALDAQVDSLQGDILGLAEDTTPSSLVLEPSVGYRSGVGGAFTGVADTPQGPGSPVTAIVTAATDGDQTITFTLITDDQVRKAAFSVTDSLMNTFRFPSEVRE
jgi:hypothetical protein